MKKLTILDTTVLLRGVQFGFKEFLIGVVNNCPMFGLSLSAARRGHKLLDAIESANGTLDVDDDIASALVATIDKPAQAWNPQFMIVAIPYLDHLEKSLK